MGNGQCPECHGVSDKLINHRVFSYSGPFGHKTGCLLSEALKELGENPYIFNMEK